MPIKIENSAFAAALDTIAHVIEARCTIPILDNVAIYATPVAGAVRFAATDLDMSIEVDANAEIDAAVSTTLPAAMLRKIAKGADKGALVSLTADGEIAADGATYRLASLPIADFPKLTEMQGGKVWQFDLDIAALHDALDATRGAISTEATRYYLNGIFMHVHAGELRTVATDGHRMYCQSLGAVDGTVDMPGVIVPTKAIKILHKLLGAKGAPSIVRLTVAPNRVDFEYGGPAFSVAIRTKTVDGTFPDYNRAIPKGGKVAAIDSAALTKAVNKVALVADHKDAAVALDFGANCTVSHNTGEGNAASAAVACDWPFDPLRIGFNERYLREVLAVAGDGVKLDMTDSGTPIRVTSNRAGWFAVLMPYRLAR